jgi:hypothetical protein
MNLIWIDFFVAIYADLLPPLGWNEAAKCGRELYPTVDLGGLHRHPKCYPHCSLSFKLSSVMYNKQSIHFLIQLSYIIFGFDNWIPRFNWNQVLWVGPKCNFLA